MGAIGRQWNWVGFSKAAIIMIMLSPPNGATSYPCFRRLLFASTSRRPFSHIHSSLLISSSSSSTVPLRQLISNTEPFRHSSGGRRIHSKNSGKTNNNILKSQQLDDIAQLSVENDEVKATTKVIAETSEERDENETITPPSKDASIAAFGDGAEPTAAVDTSNDSVATRVSWSYITGRSIRRSVGNAASTSGFLASVITSIWADRAQFQRSKPVVKAFQNFLSTSGIDLELSPSLNVHILRNVVVLSRVQKILEARSDRREKAKIKPRLFGSPKINIPSNKEALRFMKYATAVYGNNMIAAAEIDARGKFDSRLSPLTRTRISEHIDVPEEDIILVDVDYDGDGNYLRHFVAVDHVNQKVVLAIRGTFTVSEIVVDVAAFSRPCFGGEAHSEMLSMAERLWKAAGSSVLKALNENEGYELILTGHSLGAGTACLLNIMCHSNGNQLVEGRNVRCFAYAAPPVFSPLELVPRAVQSATNYIHEKDVVPFLSVDSVRHVFSSVRVIEERLKQMKRLERYKLSIGFSEPDEALIEAVREASNKRLEPKKGAPILAIPAAASIWMREQPSGLYDYEICDPIALSTLGVAIDIRMVEDHLPPRYEHAFENLIPEEREDS